MKKNLSMLYLLIIALCSFHCFKKEYDRPPDTRKYDPGLLVNARIADLRSLANGQIITEELILAGFVIMNDRSGNYYKKIVLQDSSGGLEISLDQSYLYTDYPLSRKVYIRCKGLLLENKDGYLRLGYLPKNGNGFRPIPESLIDRHLIKAGYPHSLQVDTFEVKELYHAGTAERLNNRLIAVRALEFIDAHSGIPFARPSDEAYATVLQLQNCDLLSVHLHTSAYARFQPQRTPTGNGTLTGIFHFKDEHPQLTVRDTGDLYLTGPRCNGTPPADMAVITIDSLRNLYTGFPLTLPPLKVHGIVISDRENGNVANGNVVLQGGDQDGGIVLYYSGEPDYQLGDSLEVNIGGCELKLFNGKLEVANVSVTQTWVRGTQRTIQAKDISIAELLNDPEAYESILIRLSNVSWSNAYPTWFGNSGLLEITDGSGSITHYCAYGAGFKDQSLPFPPVSQLTGYLDLHNNIPQIRIRCPGAPVHDVIP